MNNFKDVKDSLTILIDTREKKYSHITNFLLHNDIDFAKKKLDYGDYSFGIIEDNEKHSFEDKIVVERKNGLSELALNITKHRDRFERELSNDCQLHLVIEDGKWSDIYDEEYRSAVGNQSYIASLMTFLQRYNIRIHMVEKEEMGKWIYNLFYYYLREKRKEK